MFTIILVALKFEWDEQKNKINLQKHGISFEEAVKVFEDPNLVPTLDRIRNEEIRWHAIGMIAGIWLVLVVHTSVEVESDEIIRIISARYASRREERIYEEQNG